MESFNPAEGLIIVPARITGPRGVRRIRAIVDTGANVSTVNPEFLMSIGFTDADFASDGVVHTAGGKADVEIVNLIELRALGIDRRAFPVVRHALPDEALAGAVLGLDFFFDKRLTIDLRKATIDVD